MAVKLRNPKYIPKPYEQMRYPSQRIQIDVKHVPVSCLVGEAVGQKFYQYTFLDEYSRFRYLETLRRSAPIHPQSSCSMSFPPSLTLLRAFKRITAGEFTNRLNSSGTKKLTLFETSFARLGIGHKLIRPLTPRHNGKVERSHRKDNEEFYASHKFCSFSDFVVQLSRRQRQYNNFPIRPLNWLSPKQALSRFSFSVTDL